MIIGFISHDARYVTALSLLTIYCSTTNEHTYIPLSLATKTAFTSYLLSNFVVVYCSRAVQLKRRLSFRFAVRESLLQRPGWTSVPIDSKRSVNEALASICIPEGSKVGDNGREYCKPCIVDRGICTTTWT